MADTSCAVFQAEAQGPSSHCLWWTVESKHVFAHHLLAVTQNIPVSLLRENTSKGARYPWVAMLVACFESGLGDHCYCMAIAFFSPWLIDSPICFLHGVPMWP